ncbi:hypothetical protein KC354_g73 [Hortaea werneckii]|nr:hypothetical protein KC354_g73 [Hortaea werneckii]
MRLIASSMVSTSKQTSTGPKIPSGELVVLFCSYGADVHAYSLSGSSLHPLQCAHRRHRIRTYCATGRVGCRFWSRGCHMENFDIDSKYPDL